MIPYILSIDAGTTGITILLVDENGQILSKYHKEFQQYYPQPGWVEHNGEEIWDSTLKLMELAFKEYSANYCISIGITNQRETTLIWHKNNGKAIHNAIVWQCRRTNDICAKLKEEGYEKLISRKTGLLIDSYFSATKIKWLLENVEGAMENALKGKLAFGTIDSWLL